MTEKDNASLSQWDAALSWYSKLRAADEKELTSEVARDWEAWYSDAENRRVFDRVSHLLSERSRYRARPRPSKAELEEDGYDLSVPIAEYLGTHRPRETTREGSSAGRRLWLSTGAAALAAIVVLFVLSPMRLWFGGGTNRPIPYQTGIGELKNVHLSDGSSITLGGQTKLLVTFSRQRRSVELIEGQAWFTVAHNSHWPFVVAAGDGTITAVGTAFLVTRDSDRVVVTVTEGVVEVSARPTSTIRPSLNRAALGTPALAPIRVSRGEELAFHDSGALSQIKPADTQAATAWTHGRLTFDDQPLRYVIETVDRYSSRRIVVSPSAGGLRFTGIVFDSEIDDWLQSLEAIFPVIIEEHGTAVRIEMRPSTPATQEPPRTARP